MSERDAGLSRPPYHFRRAQQRWLRYFAATTLPQRPQVPLHTPAETAIKRSGSSTSSSFVVAPLCFCPDSDGFPLIPEVKGTSSCCRNEDDVVFPLLHHSIEAALARADRQLPLRLTPPEPHQRARS